MGGRKTADDADRFLLNKAGTWYYQRRTPKALRGIDSRGELIRLSLQTANLADARKRRDVYELADNERWAALLLGVPEERAKARYRSAVARAQAMGFTYKTAAELADAPLDEIGRRMDALAADPMSPADEALLGLADAPAVTVTAAWKLYTEEIATDELRGKSEQQRRKWRNAKKRGVDLFVRINGDLDMEEITREHALAMWRWWQGKIAPKAGKPTHTPSIGNRDMGAMRTLYADYFKHVGQHDRPNPFAGLSFKERDSHKRVRPAFTVDALKAIIAPGALAGMNDELRAATLALIETGCRPSELVNLTAAQINAGADVPHIVIEPRNDPEAPRELKSGTSERKVPLVGVALEVFKRFPEGFPRYREREEALSAAANKFLRENGLCPDRKLTIYGFRHAFEDRMKEAGIDAELRRILMGHKVDRETYGTGGSLEWRRQELEKIALPFDAAAISQR